MAEEEVMKMVDQLVLDQKIMQDLKMRSEKNRLDIIRSLGTYCFVIFAFSFLWGTSNTIICNGSRISCFVGKIILHDNILCVCFACFIPLELFKINFQ